MIARSLALLLGLLCCLLPLSACAQEAGRAPVAGEDYFVIADGRPWQPAPGTIEVVEIFAYWCDHCAQFDPVVSAWAKTLPKDVRFRYLPAAFSPTDQYARAFFGAEALDALGRTHAATFRAIHAEQSLPARGASADEIATHYATLGVDPARLKAAMQSPATDTRLRAAREFAVRSGLQGTPTLVVNGVYRIQGRTFDDTLRTAEALIAKERAAAGR